MKYKVFSQADTPPAESEVVDKMDLGVLDRTSLTSVVDFMLKFQKDATFSPPTREVLFDSEKYDISIDDEGDYPERYPSLESLGDDSQ